MSSTTSYLSLIRDRPAFRKLWLGELVSFFGDWFNTIALYAAVQELSGTGLALSLVMIAKTLPAFVIAPFAGPVIDRYDRRKILIATDLMRFVGAIGLVLCYRLAWLPGIYSCIVYMMLCAAFVLPAKNAVLPMILGRRELPAANALSGGTWSIMLALGAAAGGFATDQFGITASLVIDSLTYLASAAFFWGLPHLLPPGESQSRSATGFLAALRYLRRTPLALALVTLKPMMAFAGGIFTLIPLYGKEVFADARGDQYVGLLFSVRGMGAAVGALVIRLLIRDCEASMRRFVALGFATMAICYALLSVAPFFLAALAALFIAHIGAATVWVFSGTLLQLRSENDFHGRLFAIEFGGHTLMIAIASLCTGLMLDRGIPIRTITLWCAIALLPPIALWCGALWATRNQHDEEARR